MVWGRLSDVKDPLSSVEPTEDANFASHITIVDTDKTRCIGYRSLKNWKIDLRYFFAIAKDEEMKSEEYRTQLLRRYLMDGVPREIPERLQFELEQFKTTRAIAWPAFPSVVVQCYQARDKIGNFYIAPFNKLPLFMYRVIIPSIGIASLSGAQFNNWLKMAKLDAGKETIDKLTHVITYTAHKPLVEGMIATIGALKKGAFYYFESQDEEMTSSAVENGVASH